MRGWRLGLHFQDLLSYERLMGHSRKFVSQEESRGGAEEEKAHTRELGGAHCSAWREDGPATLTWVGDSAASREGSEWREEDGETGSSLVWTSVGWQDETESWVSDKH